MLVEDDKLKRITVWINSKDDDVKQVCERLEKFLSSVGLWHKIVEICEFIKVEDDK